MTSEIHQFDELSRRILQVLLSGWMTTEPVKSTAELTAAEIAARLNEPEERVLEPLALLETTGFVMRAGVPDADPTLEFKGVDERTLAAGKPPSRKYYITDNGKQLVISGGLGEQTATQVTL